MKSMVVLFTLAAVACGSLVPLAQPPQHPAIVLDPHGRPLDTAEVINARALHLQAKALEGHSSYYGAHLVHAAVSPLIAAPLISAHASPLLGYAGLGHLLKKRSLAYAAPIITPSAASHQSRVDVISRPTVVSHAVAAPVTTYSLAAPVIAPVAVSHQSRVDVRSSPAVVAHSVAVAPVVSTYSSYAAPVYSHSLFGANAALLSHGHLLKKRSLAIAHALPAAVSHQSRVDLISSPALHAEVAPVAVAHAAPVAIAHAAPAVYTAPAAVSHQSRIDVISSPAVRTVAATVVRAAPVAIAHSAPAVYAALAAVSHQSRVDYTSSHAAPLAILHPLVHSTPLAHASLW